MMAISSVISSAIGGGGYVNVATGQYPNPSSILPMNPVIGQSFTDMSGIMWIHDGSSWQWAGNQQYSHNYNNYYGPGNVYNTYTTSIPSDMLTSSYPILHTVDGPIHLIDTLKSIMDRVGIIQPDNEMIAKYPAVKEAYEEYQKEFSTALAKLHPELATAIDSYKMVIKLVKEDSNDL